MRAGGVQSLRVEPLADHQGALPALERWFEAEWPSYYGSDGPGDARADLHSYAGRAALPLGLVALLDREPCGIAVLKAESIATHRHLGPWIAAGLVEPVQRGKGIGAALVHALEDAARTLGYERIYCATATAGRLLERSGFVLLERALVDGADVAVYEKPL